MSRCSVCASSFRTKVELALLREDNPAPGQHGNGPGQQAIARRFGLSRQAIGRHWRAHVTDARKVQLTALPLKLHEWLERAADVGMTTQEYMEFLQVVLAKQIDAAEAEGDRYGVAALAGRQIQLAQYLKPPDPALQRAVTSITNNIAVLPGPTMGALQRMLNERLRPYPDAARAVMEGLEQLNAYALNGGAAAPALPALEHAS